MSVRAEGSNAPLRKREKEAIECVKQLTAKYVAEGMKEEEAREKAQIDCRK